MKDTQTIYIAGPMRRRPRFNFPAFDAAAELLRGFGHQVCNPAERDREHGFTGDGLTGVEDLAALGFSLRDALAYDLDWICTHATTVVVLPGWENSRGAAAETATAAALGIPVQTLFDIVQPHGATLTGRQKMLLTATGYAADQGSQVAAWDELASTRASRLTFAHWELVPSDSG